MVLANRTATRAPDRGYVSRSTGERGHLFLGTPPVQGVYDLRFRLDQSISPAPSRLTLSSRVIGQIEEIGSGVREAVQSKLLSFAYSDDGGLLVDESTLDSTTKLAAWLSQNSSSVSALVADDGLLSMSAKFEGVELFVEISRNGSAEAAVARSPMDVVGVDVTSVKQLTPEMILGAVRSP